MEKDENGGEGRKGGEKGQMRNGGDEKRGKEKGEGERHPLYSPEISNGPSTGTFRMNMRVWMGRGGRGLEFSNQ